MFLTVFTPTYNRAYSLDRLYQSLLKQTDLDFEWILVDDGSTDHTKDLVSSWTEKENIHFRYEYQENAGKPAAHNTGVKLAEGEFFVCLDSDDYFTEDAVKQIKQACQDLRPDGIGILGKRQCPDGKKITTISDTTVDYSTLRDAYKKHGLKGDTMLVFKTEVLKKFEFPVFEGEKFIPEGYLYNKLDKVGKLKICDISVYMCEYLPDGYTANVDKLIYNNYKGYAFHITERIKYIDDFKDKVLDTIRYDSVMIAHKDRAILKNAANPVLAILCYLPGVMVSHKRYREFR